MSELSLHNSRPQVTFKVPSYYTANALRWQYIDYICVASHRSITAFQVEVNSTFMRHRNANRNAVALDECAVRQCNTIAV